MPVIPFYGADRHSLFSIERAAMDRPGHVTAALDAALPTHGLVLDVGAGDGFTASRLHTETRTVVPLEPARKMIRGHPNLAWTQGDAEHLPFADASFDAAYATWAYFFSRNWIPDPGISELHRVVKPGGPLLIVDNLGDDEFCALASSDISADPGYWSHRGFECSTIDTWFEFENLADARTLLGFFFGESQSYDSTHYSFRVGLFSAPSDGLAAQGQISATASSSSLKSG